MTASASRFTLLTGLTALLVLGAACRRADPAGPCQAAYSAEDWERAVEACAARMESADRGGLERLAEAYYRLERTDELADLAERLGEAPDAAIAWQWSGTALAEQGKRGEARRSHERAYARRRPDDSLARARDALSISRLAWQLSDLDGAFEYVALATEHATPLENRELLARAHLQRETLFEEIGDLQGARGALEAAKAITERRGILWGTIIFKEAIHQHHEGRQQIARKTFERALEFGDREKHRGFFVSIYFNLLQIAVTAGDIESGDRYLNSALALLGTKGDPPSPVANFRAIIERERGELLAAEKTLRTAIGKDPGLDWRFELEHTLGTVLERGGDATAAAQAYLRAIEAVEKRRREFGYDALKPWLLERLRKPYESLFLLQIASGNVSGGAGTADRALASGFVDEFVRDYTPVASSGDILASGKEAGARVAALTGIYEQLGSGEAPTGHSGAPPTNRLERINALVYFRAGDDVWLIRAGSGRLGAEKLKLAPAGIEKLIDKFVAAPATIETSEALGAALLPAGALPKRGTTIHVVADGSVGRLPFAALRINGRFVAQDYAVVYAPNLSVLALRASERAAKLGSAVVLADPRGDLPAARAEARAVAAALEVAPLVGAAASLAAVEKSASASHLHLAVHGGLSSTGPWLGLADGQLSPTAVVERKLGPAVVVLASCASGARPGRGVWGSLGGAFLAAGSSAVISALWAVEDEVARDFVLRFYEAGGAKDPIGAVARAKRVAISQSLSPSAWAPFVILTKGAPDALH